MDATHLKHVNAARMARRAVVRMIDLADGGDTIIIEGDRYEERFTTTVRPAFQSGKSGLVEIAGRRYFLNVYLPPPQIVVIGAVHISQALAPMAKIAGFDIRIIDPRTAFAMPDRFAGVDLCLEWPEDAMKARPLDAYTALVALAHDPRIDDLPLAEALRAECFYIGALGSRKSHASRLERLQQRGFSTEMRGKIRGPIGLDIGAASPAEIAVSILAEIVQTFRRRPVLMGDGE